MRSRMRSRRRSKRRSKTRSTCTSKCGATCAAKEILLQCAAVPGGIELLQTPKKTPRGSSGSSAGHSFGYLAGGAVPQVVSLLRGFSFFVRARAFLRSQQCNQLCFLSYLRSQLLRSQCSCPRSRRAVWLTLSRLPSFSFFSSTISLIRIFRKREKYI